MNTRHFEIFTSDQLQNIKKIIASTRLWGDATMVFGNDLENQHYAFGFETNLKLGKEWSGVCSGLSKTVTKAGTNAFAWCSDYWGDGSGDMLFVNMDVLECDDVNELLDFVKNI